MTGIRAGVKWTAVELFLLLGLEMFNYLMLTEAQDV